MSYLSWHYRTTNRFLIRFCLNYLAATEHFFSIGILFKTMLAPWRRVISVKSSSGLSIPEMFERLSFNLVSRVIGFFVRLVLIVWGLVTILVLLVISSLLLVIWQIFIPFSLPIYYLCLYKNRDQLKELLALKQPYLIWHKIIISDLGDFLSLRLGLDKKALDELSVIGGGWSYGGVSGNPPNELKTITKTSQLLFLLARDWQPLNNFLFQNKIIIQDLVAVGVWYEKIEEKKKENSRFWDKDKLVRGSGLGWNLSYGYTPELEKYVTDLTLPLEFSHRLVGRRLEVAKIEEVLSRQAENNVLLTGEPGVGKHTIILSFARRVYNGLVSFSLKHKRVLQLELNRVVRDAPLTEAKTRVLSLFKEAISAGNIIFVISNIDKFVSAGGGGTDLTDVFAQVAKSDKIQIIGITEPSAYHQYIAGNDQFLKLFEKIDVAPASPDSALQVLMLEVPMFEKKKKTKASYQSLKEIISLSDRLITEAPFPEKALDLLDEAITRFERKNKKIITKQDIDELVSEKTKVPVGNVSGRESEKLAKIEDFLHQRIIDQNEAIKAVASALRRRRLGVAETKKPIGVFLFMGPTGVGKTETAKALAQVYFGSDKNLIRFDMSQYQQQSSLDNLLGSKIQGTGLLSQKIKDNPFSVLLLDELEKADRNLLNIFLTIFDEGYLTDYRGKKVSFSDTIIIATSNAGAEFIREHLKNGGSYETLQSQVIDYIQEQGIYNPEFLNRFDSVVVFKPLEIPELKQIAKLQLDSLNKRLAKNDIQIKIDEALLSSVAQGGYSPEFGARPMKRWIADKIEDLIAKALLAKKLSRGAELKLVWDEGSNSYQFL